MADANVSTAAPPTAARPSGEPKARWGLRVFGGMLLVGLSAFIVHAWWASRAGVALRGVVRGIEGRGEPMRPEALEQAPVSDGENAAVDLMAAAAAAPASTQPFVDVMKVGHQLPWTKKEAAAVAAARGAMGPVLDGVAAASRKPKSDWRVKMRSPTLSVLLPSLNFIRHLANLTAVAALDAHVRGDDVLALERVSQILAIARTTEQMAPTLVRHLVAVGVYALGCGVVEQITPELKSDDPAVRAKAMALARELVEEEAQLREGLRTALLGERVFVLDTAQCIVSGRLTLSQIAGMNGGGRNAMGFGTVSGAMTAAPGGGYLGKPFVLSDARLVLEHETDMLAAIESTTDWPSLRTKMAAIEKAWDAKRKAGELHELAMMMTPSFTRCGYTQYRAVAEGRMAAMLLAVRCYVGEHGGKLPGTVEALVPGYLAKGLADPFAPDGHGLRYEPRAGDPIVYSVDENGVDDKGSETPVRVGSALTRAPRWQALDAVMHLGRQVREAESIEEGMKDEDPNKPKSTDPTQN